MEQNQIVIYQTEDGQTQIDVRLENDTVWLTQAQMAELFQKNQSVVARHINNAVREGELEETQLFCHCFEILFYYLYNFRMLRNDHRFTASTRGSSTNLTDLTDFSSYRCDFSGSINNAQP